VAEELADLQARWFIRRSQRLQQRSASGASVSRQQTELQLFR